MRGIDLHGNVGCTSLYLKYRLWQTSFDMEIATLFISLLEMGVCWRLRGRSWLFSFPLSFFLFKSQAHLKKSKRSERLKLECLEILLDEKCSDEIFGCSLHFDEAMVQLKPNLGWSTNPRLLAQVIPLKKPHKKNTPKKI